MAASLRVVVTGATGNVGTSVLQAMSEDANIASVLGLARRKPELTLPKVRWAAVDLSEENPELSPEEGPEVELAKLFSGADAVVHLAWRFQPTHDPAVTWRANVLGTLRVLEAVALARVPALVAASSVGAYSPGPGGDVRVTEDWPTHGWPGASYCVEKAYLERVLDHWESEHPDTRVVRMRPAFLFKETAASEQRRIFGGRFLPGLLFRPDLLPVVPGVRGLRVQALHTDDAADAYLRAVERDVRGAFNLAAEPVLDGAELGKLLDARIAALPAAAVRAILAAGWNLRAVPASPSLFDAVLRLPLLDCARATRELDWRPRRTAVEAVEEFLSGVRAGKGLATPPLAGHTAH